VKVVFDTNVIASASFWRGAPLDCLAAWARGCCQAVVSAGLLAEYHETVEELRMDYPNRKCVEWVEVLTESAELVFPVERASGATIDPDDEMILECALAAEADFIVSGDKKHLLALRQYQGIPIISPADFLRRLAAL
jgi:putative PIN family toxin of toxin-antitoxin system